MATTKWRQGIGFPDWEIVDGGNRLFDWYNPETVTELGFVLNGSFVRLAVSDRDRRVIRAAFVGSDDPVPLSAVHGLVRVCHGPDSFGHTEWHVADADF